MAGAARARLLVGRVRREAAGVADGGRVDAGRLPEEALGAPEAAHADDDSLEAVGEGRHDRRAEDEVRGDDRHRRVAPGERRLGGRQLDVLAEEEAHALTVARVSSAADAGAQACGERLLEVGPERVGVLEPDGEPEQPGGDAVALPAVARLELRADAAEARRVLDRPHRPLDAPGCVAVGDVERDEEREARVAHRPSPPDARRAAPPGCAPTPPGGRGARRASRARAGRATPCPPRRRSPQAAG